MNMEPMMMKAGKYYVGDLCYVMNPEWDEVCRLSFPVGSEHRDGDMTLENGVRIASFSTAYGDGFYEDNVGNSYGVDSGSIGCILLSDISDPNADLSGGAVIDFPTDFEVSSDGEVLMFGHIFIQTGDDDDMDDEDMDDEEDEQNLYKEKP